MSRVIRALLLSIFILSSSLSAFSIYEDRESQISGDEIFSYEHKFYPQKEDSFAYLDSTFWLKFDFSKEKDLSSEKYILFNFAVLNYADMFYKSSGVLKVVNSGAGIKKELPFNEVVFRVPLDRVDNKIVYIRVKHNGMLSLENRVFDSKSELFELLKLRSDTTVVMLATSILIMLFIAILAYNIKESTYRLYLVFLILSIVMQLAINNSLTWLIGVNAIDFVFQVAIDLTAVSFYFFVINITHMKENFPKMYKIFKLLAVFTLYLFVSELFQSREMHVIKTLYVVPTLLMVVFSCLVYMLYKGVKYSTLIFIGWLFLFGASVILYLSINGVLSSVYCPIIWKFFIVMKMITFSLLLLYRIKELADENIKHELVLEEQSKLAVIGETLTNIEHQWRSPLSKISSNIIALETELEIKGKVENRSLKKSLHSMTDTLEYMTNLVDYFKVFYMKDQEKKPFLVENSYLRVSRLLEYDFINHKIDVEYVDDDKVQILGHLNEFTQVMLNILSNSRDIFIQRKIQKPKIKIAVLKKNSNVIITIEDNAGGIKDSNIDNIFNQFFSDKEKQSTGVGLYLCKHIVEKKMDGTIRVENKNLGAKFTIKL